MNKLSLLALAVLVLSACGRPATPPAPPAAAPAPVSPPADTALAAAPVAAWTDLETLHEPMESNGDQMKALRTAMRAGDWSTALAQTNLLATAMTDLAAKSRGFQGETPDRFRAFSDSAAAESARLRDALTAAAAPNATADPAALNATLESFRATCKSCHDVYKKD